jgi:hypothetical protein
MQRLAALVPENVESMLNGNNVKDYTFLRASATCALDMLGVAAVH